jgi:hypothetical protein
MTEEQAIQKLIDLLITQVKHDYPEGMVRRDAHAKAHGCVYGEFIVEPNLPEHLRVGIFEEPRTIPCRIRFSNSGGTGGIHPDKNRDVRGMAVKLGDDDTQDFLMASHPTFVVKNATDFAQLTEALVSQSIWRMFIFYLARLRFRELYLLVVSQKTCANVLGQRYWSMVPYQLGPDQHVKYTTIPRTPVTMIMPSDPTPDFLRERLRQHLATDEAVFDFAVQLRLPDMPLDDARSRWSEKQSPFIKVATIRIPSQSFESPEQETACENLSYTPWHTLPEHQPVGSINRARRAVYDAISRYRHEANDEPFS